MTADDRAVVDAGYRALRDDVGACWLDRDVLVVAGPDAVEWLQGQLSQDVAALATDESSWSLLLQPQGKVDALLRVTRRADDEIVLDTDGGWGEHVAARLRRFRLRVKADVEPLGWRCLALRGPRASEVAPAPLAGALVVPGWPTTGGVDVLADDPAVPAGVPVVASEAYEALRIEAGLPRMGAELDETTIPVASGVVPHTVSFTKGCYTGQELVARIDSRGGNVPRHLRGVVLADGDRLPPPGADLLVGDASAGSLTSVAWSPDHGVVALAYVTRSVEPPADAVVAWDGERRAARIEPLPLLS